MKDVISVDITVGVSSYKELVEKLAAIEHERWSDWQSWVHTVYENPTRPFEEAIKNWKRQIDTPYAELTEQEKQSDRRQVQRYLPLLHSLLISKLPDKRTDTIDFTKNVNNLGQLTKEARGFNQAIVDMYQVIDEMFEVQK